MTQFNYNKIHFWLLSFFGFLVILALTGQIKSAIYLDFAIKYSIFGIIICLFSWNFESKIINEINLTAREYQIEELIDDLMRKRWILVGILVTAFIFNVFFSDEWLIFYPVFVFIYLLSIVFT
jgi:hypothetical protein